MMIINQTQSIISSFSQYIKKRILNFSFAQVNHYNSCRLLILMLKSIIVILLIFTLTESVIHVRDGRLVDDLGGQLIFHGLNVVSKVPPYHTTFSQEDMQFFQAAGINGIRLGVMWPGVEPKKQQFNQTYLSYMRKTVDDAGKYRIYTLVQFHQDIFSQKFCADGVPVWAIPEQISKDFPRPLNIKKFQFDANGFPRWQDCGKHAWAEYYFSNSVAKGFGSLWTNRHGLRDMFIKYWRKVAETFKGDQFVIAYQLVNEPWPGDQYINPLVMVPGLSETIDMQHAYDIIADNIREIDPEHSICFEPVTYLNLFRAGFTHPPGGKQHSNTSIFCYHYYKPPTFNLKSFMKARMKDVNRLNSGGMLTQFYVIDAEGQKNIAMMNECDANLQSWFGWIYPIQQKKWSRFKQSQHDIKSILYNKDGSINSELIKGITRTYAPRVAGKTISQNYNPQTKKFVLIYEICNVCGQTSIFISEEHIYTKGFNVIVFPTDGVKIERDGEFYLKVSPRHVPANTKINITITAK